MRTCGLRTRTRITGTFTEKGEENGQYEEICDGVDSGLS